MAGALHGYGDEVFGCGIGYFENGDGLVLLGVSEYPDVREYSGA